MGCSGCRKAREKFQQMVNNKVVPNVPNPVPKVNPVQNPIPVKTRRQLRIEARNIRIKARDKMLLRIKEQQRLMQEQNKKL
jgi:microcompartment protein CcmL/EutN